MKKKLLAILLTVSMVLSMAPAALAADSVFTDVKAGDWFADEVKYVYDNGLMNGVGDNAFDPSGTVTRAMVWTTLARLDGFDTTGSDPWWLAGQKWAMENGISDGTMAENNVTREQLVTMIWRYAKYVDMDVSEGEDTNILSYTDAFDVNEWAISAMQWACAVGIINGIDGTLQPQGDASRAMLAAILYRFVEEVMPEEEEPKPSTPVVPSYPSYPSIPVHFHSWTAGTPVAPTCTTEGYTPYTCVCGASKNGDTVPAVSHVAGEKCLHCGVTEVTTAAQAQAALDNAAPGTIIQLAENVDYGVLYLRPIDGSPATKIVDWQGNDYRWETYTLFENLTIIGAEGATIDAIEIEGGTYYNTAHSQSSTYPIMLSLIELKNVTIKNVTFTGDGGEDPQGHGNAINLSGNNIKVNGLNVENCVLNNENDDARLIYKTESTTFEHTYIYDSQTYTFVPNLKDITVTGCTFNGGYMAVELRETENVTITNNTFNGLSSRNILLPTNSGCTYSGTVTITGNTSDGAVERFVRANEIGNATLIIAGNTIKNYKSSDADYIKVTGATGETIIENNTLVSVASTAAAQAMLDAAAPGTIIQLAENVDYGVLYLRPIDGSPATKTVDWIGNNYRYETYSCFENLTIIGAEGATIDAIEIEGGTYYNTEHSQSATYPIMLSLIELKNVTIKNVIFTGKGGYDPQGHGNVINLSGNNIKVDGLTLENCVLNDENDAGKEARLIYKTESTTHEHSYSYDGETYTFLPTLKDITVTGCTFNGGYMGLELRETENVTITNNTFNNMTSRNILLPTNSGCTYSGTVTITGNTSDGAVERFVRADQIGNAKLIITGNTIKNYKSSDADYIKVTGATGETTIEDNTLVSVASAAAAQAMLDAAVPGITIQLAPGVNYGTLYLRPSASNPATKEVDWVGNNYYYETYSLFENLAIKGATGATIDAIVIEGGVYYNTAHSQSSTHPIMLSLIELKNVVIDGVTFTGNGGCDPQGRGNAINVSGQNIKVNGLTLKDCVLNGVANNARLFYKTENTTYVHIYTYGGDTYTFAPSLENITVTGCVIDGAHIGLEFRETKNLTITNNTIKNTSSVGVVLGLNSGATYSAGTVTITGNEFENCAGGALDYVLSDMPNDFEANVIANNTGLTDSNVTGW